MASPASQIREVPQGPIFVHSDFSIPAEKWASIMGQESAFTRTGDTLYISKCEGLRSAKGVFWAFALEALGVICALGIWRLIH